MTDHIHALAMRTKAAAEATPRDNARDSSYAMGWNDGIETIAHRILALPLEADHAAILSEAVNIGEVRALLWAARHAISILSPHFNHASRGALETALKPFAALETP